MDQYMSTSDALYTYRFSDSTEDEYADDAPKLQRYIAGEWEFPDFWRNPSIDAQRRWYILDQPIREAQERQVRFAEILEVARQERLMREANDLQQRQVSQEARELRRREQKAHMRRPLAIFLENFTRLCEIWRADSNFNMPISTPPDQKDAVLDENPVAEYGLTIATERKMYTSYDIVFSTNAEVNALLENSGGSAFPLFWDSRLSIFKGPRKAMYNKLLDAGFLPSTFGTIQ